VSRGELRDKKRIYLLHFYPLIPSLSPPGRGEGWGEISNILD
jgi:hypothetical protein